MKDDTSRLEDLFKKFYLDTATPEEISELATLLKPHGQTALELVLKKIWINEEPTDIFSEDHADAIFNRVLSHDRNDAAQIEITDHKVRRFSAFTRIAIAASFIGILVLGYFLLSPPSKEPAVVVTKIDSTEQDISPGRNGGILTLSNGEEILLDEKANGTVANEGQVKVVKEDGQITYEGENESGNYYNVLRTPRGRQYHLVLADGSKVWLNASSSISYPATFSNNERVIEITGEAYLEVARDLSKPFRVKLYDGSRIEVTGTHFNVNSYPDESDVKTTLLEGGVRVSKGREILKLKPGQQAVTASNTMKMYPGVNIEEVMAWKNGFFSFQKTGLKTIMREISRWYDVDVIYEGNVPEVSFSGEIGRSLTLKQVLSILDETRIHYKIEGKKLIITP